MNKSALQIIIERELIGQPEIEKTNKIKHTNKKRKVQCINDKKIFTCIGDAAHYAGLTSSGTIRRYLKNNKNHNGAGRHPKTGELLRWKYVDE